MKQRCRWMNGAKLHLSIYPFIHLHWSEVFVAYSELTPFIHLSIYIEVKFFLLTQSWECMGKLKKTSTVCSLSLSSSVVVLWGRRQRLHAVVCCSMPVCSTNPSPAWILDASKQPLHIHHFQHLPHSNQVRANGMVMKPLASTRQVQRIQFRWWHSLPALLHFRGECIYLVHAEANIAHVP